MDERTEDRARQVLMDQLAHYHGEPNGAWDVLADDLLSALTEANVTLSTPGGPWVDADGRRWVVAAETTTVDRILCATLRPVPDVAREPVPFYGYNASVEPDVAREAPEGDAERCAWNHAEPERTCPGCVYLHPALLAPAAPAATTCPSCGGLRRVRPAGADARPEDSIPCPACRPEPAATTCDTCGGTKWVRTAWNAPGGVNHQPCPSCRPEAGEGQ